MWGMALGIISVSVSLQLS